MEDCGSSSKRRRPTYLPDYMNSDSESEKEIKQIKNNKKAINKVIHNLKRYLNIK